VDAIRFFSTKTHPFDIQSMREVLPVGEVVMVADDYHTGKSTPIPQDCREKVGKFEGVRSSSRNTGERAA
jgi:acyl-CoA thioesterase FadM